MCDSTATGFLEQTLAYWRFWGRALHAPIEWRDAVVRAAIALELNVYEQTGAIVAAITTSIPEAPNSGRNWDYRYCWPRDACFVVNALSRVGEVRRRSATSPFSWRGRSRPIFPLFRCTRSMVSRFSRRPADARATAGWARGIGNKASEQHRRHLREAVLTAESLFRRSARAGR